MTDSHIETLMEGQVPEQHAFFLHLNSINLGNIFF